MIPPEIDALLLRSFDDRRLARGERQELSELLVHFPSLTDREAIRHRAFEIARAAPPQPDGVAVLDWLEAVIKATRDLVPAGPSVVAEAYFSPGDDCSRAIGRLLAQAKQTADLCVFTITDDRLADAVLATHRRGVAVRIIADDAKADDLGSDIERFERAGIATRVDRSPAHMHHKFAIFDATTLLTGSYNWTRGAARENEENLIITTDTRFLTPFGATFQRLWTRLGPA